MSWHIMNQIPPQELARQADELELWINNTRSYYERKIDIYKNLWKKYQAGVFNKTLAAKAFSSLTDEAARDYNKQGFEDIHISVRARRVLDTAFVSEFLANAKNREYDFMR